MTGCAVAGRITRFLRSHDLVRALGAHDGRRWDRRYTRGWGGVHARPGNRHRRLVPVLNVGPVGGPGHDRRPVVDEQATGDPIENQIKVPVGGHGGDGEGDDQTGVQHDGRVVEGDTGHDGQGEVAVGVDVQCVAVGGGKCFNNGNISGIFS